MLTGEIQSRGMVLPFTSDIYRPMLSRLRKEGIVAREEVRPNNNVTKLETETVRY